eukprot:gene7881-8693_t
MICAISGEVPKDPVVSTTTRLVYERSLIERAIAESNKCPVTGETLSQDSLLAIRTPNQIKSKGLASGTPGIISILQKEWDDLTLEVFSLRQQLDLTRKELAQALYQHDAACRVVARLVRERDEAFELLRTVQAQPPQASAEGAMEVEAAAPAAVPAEAGISNDLLDELNAVCKNLSSARKHRKVSEHVVRKEAVAKMREQHRLEVFRSSPPSAFTTLDTNFASALSPDDQEGLVLVGDDAGGVQVLSSARRAVVLTAPKAHEAAITSAVFLPEGQSSSPAFITAGLDRTLTAWKIDQQEQAVATFRYRHHLGGVTGLTAHSSLPLAISVSEDSYWRIFDLSRGLCLRSVEEEGTAFSAARLHPDGLVLGLGSRSGRLGIWDIREQQCVAKLEEHTGALTGVDFSENGYLAATTARDGVVKIWDLRKLKSTKTLQVGMSEANAVRFDHSGSYLAVVGKESESGLGRLSVQIVKEWSEAYGVTAPSPLHGVAWGAFGQSLFVSSQDGTVTVHGV